MNAEERFPDERELCENCGKEKWDNTGIGTRVGVAATFGDVAGNKFCHCDEDKEEIL